MLTKRKKNRMSILKMALILILIVFPIFTLFHLDQRKVISFEKPTTADKRKFTCESFGEELYWLSVLLTASILMSDFTFDSQHFNVRFWESCRNLQFSKPWITSRTFVLFQVLLTTSILMSDFRKRRLVCIDFTSDSLDQYFVDDTKQACRNIQFWKPWITSWTWFL